MGDTLARRGTVVPSGAFLGGDVRVDLRRPYSCHRIIGVRTGNPASVAVLREHAERGFRAVLDRMFPVSPAPRTRTGTWRTTTTSAA